VLLKLSCDLPAPQSAKTSRTGSVALRPLKAMRCDDRGIRQWSERSRTVRAPKTRIGALAVEPVARVEMIWRPTSTINPPQRRTSGDRDEPETCVSRDAPPNHDDRRREDFLPRGGSEGRSGRPAAAWVPDVLAHVPQSDP